jgi:hypothetical protein
MRDERSRAVVAVEVVERVQQEELAPGLELPVRECVDFAQRLAERQR